jgi:hypothetical protein
MLSAARSSSASRQPILARVELTIARMRVADERVACEERAAVGGTHAALVYLAAEGRAGGYDLRVARGAAQTRPRDSPSRSLAALTRDAAAAGPYTAPNLAPTLARPACACCVHAGVERVGTRDRR